MELEPRNGRDQEGSEDIDAERERERDREREKEKEKERRERETVHQGARTALQVQLDQEFMCIYDAAWLSPLGLENSPDARCVHHRYPDAIDVLMESRHATFTFFFSAKAHSDRMLTPLVAQFQLLNVEFCARATQAFSRLCQYSHGMDLSTGSRKCVHGVGQKYQSRISSLGLRHLQSRCTQVYSSVCCHTLSWLL